MIIRLASAQFSATGSHWPLTSADWPVSVRFTTEVATAYMCGSARHSMATWSLKRFHRTYKHMELVNFQQTKEKLAKINRHREGRETAKVCGKFMFIIKRFALPTASSAKVKVCAIGQLQLLTNCLCLLLSVDDTHCSIVGNIYTTNQAVTNSHACWRHPVTSIKLHLIWNFDILLPTMWLF